MPRGFSAQKPINSNGSTNSFLTSIQPLGNHVLPIDLKPTQSWCGSSEGWGPFSPHRYVFTQCFVDIWMSCVALYGIVFGLITVVWLIRKKNIRPVTKDWHFWTKQAIIILIILSALLQLLSQTYTYPEVLYDDTRFLASVLTILSLGVIFTIQWLEHARLRQPHGVVLFYWLLTIIAWSIKLHSLINQKEYRSSQIYFHFFCFGYILSWIEFGLEWLVPKKKSAYELIDSYDESPIEYATVFSILTFSWMTPMMRAGYSKYLTEDDLWNVEKRNTTKATGDSFSKAWNAELEKSESRNAHQKGKKPSLWMAVIKAFYGPYLRGSLFKVISDTLAFVQPQLLRLIIAFVKSYKKGNPGPPQPIVHGILISLAMFAASIFQTIALHQYFQRAFDTGMRVRIALTSAIYKKSLKLSNEGRSNKTTGDIVNLMAVDTQRLQDLTQYGQQLWSAPFQIILCSLSLYNLLGVSMFAGLGVMILMIPINGVIARFMKTLQEKQMKYKDSRTKLITEIINNMKSIKLFAWGNAFSQKLNFIRNDQELKNLKKIGATQSVANFTWSSTPFLVSCATFTVFVLFSDRPLTTDIVFPALTLFNLLTFPLAILPMVISSVIEASVAVNRLKSFFVTEELQEDALIIKDAVEELGEESVLVRDGTFTWDRHSNCRELEDIYFTASKGDLSCIVGRVGAGKSSLLQAILGDLWKVEGEVVVHGRTAYVAQQPWIMNATVKENILFGYRYDPEFYNKTINACALNEDFAQLPYGDETQVGERGISLSGGQKARLTLARAVYARADIYLLDDCLSAVDQHVGRHLIDNVFGPNGLLRGKTRILATNSIPVLKEADFIYLLRDGRIVEKGTYLQLMAMKGEISTLMKTAGSREQTQEESEQSSCNSTIVATEENDIGNSFQADFSERFSDIQPVQQRSNQRKKSTSSLGHASMASLKGHRAKTQDEESDGQNKQNKEISEKGNVKLDVYKEYAKKSNISAVFLYGLFLIGAQTAQVAANFWLKSWAEVNDASKTNPHVGKYLGIYFALGINGSLLVVVQSLVLWIFCSIEASKKLHGIMASAIFRSPMSFFETTPAGRILNRFSSDIYRVDEVLARTFNMLFVNLAKSLFTLIVISISTPAFISLIIPFAGLYYWIQRYYLRTSRELKRLDSVSRSPIYAHFQESLGGISTIRAYRQQERFVLENNVRIDTNTRAYSPSINANRWLAIRLEFIGSVVILCAAGFAIMSVATGSEITDGMVGLSLSYALQITQSLNWIVRQTVEVETNIVSVERVLEYGRLPSEAPEIIVGSSPPEEWPASGAVQFENYSTRYRKDLDLVLKDINISIKPHEKIGVVGRTGAGKSSLTLALFRIIEPCEGNITIDELNTSDIGLLNLRSRLSIIPQDAALFEGTIKDNLDPAHTQKDADLWSALEHAQLKKHVISMSGGLDAKIQEGGSNLSQGQRQLISLARALLSKSNILVLDEATAAVDVETDKLIQNTLRGPIFKNRSIITIAHRINTILDCDRIVVLEAGRVVEFDSPENLLKIKDGSFRKLHEESGLSEPSSA
ncbi:Metal resistance protein YCF1 [Golovinomyces cichoracearum]|uniref:Metal resistance protein YCF1 n=1 Tax=Golovinomyces cichoracearum TaxID=62708 RepID=A0A420HC81_9PEZI|nr:Metal resistance protein YCF1 [Golovinomyces cichoracearum]